MKENNFTVKMPMRERSGLVIWTVIFVFLLIASAIVVDMTTFGLIVIGAMVLWLMLSMLSSLIGRVSVDESALKVTTSCGRKYQMFCRDIVKISCKAEQTTHKGAQIYITVATEEEQVSVEGRMKEFDTFAGYLFDKLASGEIRASAASEKCMEDLAFYREGVMAKKRAKT